jgi:outer membrane protein assembly factor BamB
VVANGWPWILAYDLETGRELWRLRGGGDNPIPTPFAADGLIFITNAHGGKSPIFAVRPDASGDISATVDHPEKFMAWSTEQGGSYISTPVVYRGQIYLGNTNGVLRSHDSRSGKKIYEERLAPGASIYASLTAGDGKIFCPSEDGTVYVVAAGPDFKLLAANSLDGPCFATPAISDGMLYFRTTSSLVAVGPV